MTGYESGRAGGRAARRANGRMGGGIEEKLLGTSIYPYSGFPRVRHPPPNWNIDLSTLNDSRMTNRVTDMPNCLRKSQVKNQSIEKKQVDAGTNYSSGVSRHLSA